MALGKNFKSIQAQSSPESELVPDPLKMEEINSDQDDHEKLVTTLYCIFDAGGEEYAIPMELVKEVVKMPETTPTPQMPIYFSSMTNVRGEVYGILDLSLFFKGTNKTKSYPYLLILNNEEYRVAIALNQVPNTLKVNENMIEELSSSTFGSLKGKKYLSGIVKDGKQMIILFDVQEMISSKNFTEDSIAD